MRSPASLLVLAVVVVVVSASGTFAKDARTFGKGVAAPESVRVGDLLRDPEAHVGKVVRVTGRITDVCPMAGCWIDIKDEERAKVVRFKVEDGVIVFPLDVKGKDVVAEGIFRKIEMTRDEAIAHARHEAEERGTKFDPATVTGPVVQYRIDGTGAVVR